MMTGRCLRAQRTLVAVAHGGRMMRGRAITAPLLGHNDFPARQAN
jgi:hypothetical protein